MKKPLTAIFACAALALQNLHAQEVRRAEPVETLTQIVPQSSPSPTPNSDAAPDATPYPTIQPFFTPAPPKHYPKPGENDSGDSSDAKNSPTPIIRRAVPVTQATPAPAANRHLPNANSAPSPSPSPKKNSAKPAQTPSPESESSDEANQAISRIAPTPEAANDENQGDPALIQFQYANGIFARKQYDMAAPEYQKYLDLYPQGADRAAALFRLGECYRNLGSANAMRKAYQSVLTESLIGDSDSAASPFIGLAAYRLADIDYQAHDYEGALPLFRKASVRLQEPAVVLAAKFFTAHCLEHLGQETDALPLYQSILETPGNVAFRDLARLGLAKLLANHQRKPDALTQLRILIEQTDKPDLKAEALVRSGLLELDLKQNQKAETDFATALQIPEIGAWKEVAQLGQLRLLFQNGKYETVLKNYAANRDAFSPQIQPEALLLIADSHRMLGQTKDALDLYNQLLTGFPDSSFAAQARYETIVTLYNSDSPDLGAAIDNYLATNPPAETRDQVLLIKAESFYKQKRYADALPAYEALAISSHLAANLKPQVQFKLGWCDLQTGAADKAIEAFTAFLKDNPTSPLAATALVERALANQQLKQYDAALRDFDKLIADYPHTRERELALQQKALILGQQQDDKGMVATFRQLLAEYPKTAAAAEANYWIGSVAFDAKNYQDAIAPLTTARKLNPKEYYERATQRIMLANYYLQNCDAVAAIVRDYTKHGEAPVRPEILRWLGQQYFINKQFANAEAFLALLTKRKDDAQLDDWLNLGRAQAANGQFADAEKSLGTYLDGAKEPFPRANGFLALGEAQLGEKNYDSAQKSADQVCTLQPEGQINAEGRLLAGRIAEARGDYATAAKLYLSISLVFDDPNITPAALQKACDAYKKAGDDAAAAKTLNTLQTRYPEYWQKISAQADGSSR